MSESNNPSQSQEAKARRRVAVNGVLVVDKPEKISSMGVVSVVRGRSGGARTGHAGTLDPLATGVLVVALGRATKVIEQLMVTDKRYRTEIDLRAFTTTDDREGEVEPVEAAPPSESEILAALKRFEGVFDQRPPDFSAIKVGGQRAYKVARQGGKPAVSARPVRVDSIELVRYEWPFVELEIACGKGFYVRSLARDLGKALGTGGFCQSIRRLAVGPFTLDESVRLDDVPEPLEESSLMTIDEALGRVGAE